jgi:glycosyltransferase involved in cell wall biosynthesis
MIVKNEAQVITRCLASVKPLIDYWVIVDTGSTDGTQEIIQQFLADIPGELHQSSWRNFGENRTEAFELAKYKGDYILFMDADDTLEWDEDVTLPHLSSDLYNFWRGTKSFSYIKPQLVRGDLPWKWVGVTHEYLDCKKPYTSKILEGIHYVSGDGGARSGVEKFWKNIELLTEGLKEEPNNIRYMFYLAESYKDAGEKAKALEWYQKRAMSGGWSEEVFWSKLQIAHILRDLRFPATIVILSYEDAHAFRPHRIEPIYYLVEFLNQQEEYLKAYEWICFRESLSKPLTRDYLFNEDWIQDYGFLFQKSICSYYVGQYQESLDACNQLLLNPQLPQVWRELVESNRLFPLEMLR